MTIKYVSLLVSGVFLGTLNTFSQAGSISDCEKSATIILFRTFDIFNFGRSYKLYENDSLLGRMKTHDVLILETYKDGVSFHAQTKAPSLNATKRTNFKKIKKVKYPITVLAGNIYFVKCGYLNQNIFDMPRQPTIRLMKTVELRKCIKKRFIQKKIKSYLYQEWITGSTL